MALDDITTKATYQQTHIMRNYSKRCSRIIFCYYGSHAATFDSGDALPPLEANMAMERAKRRDEQSPPALAPHPSVS